jgi:hypothetical protein
VLRHLARVEVPATLRSQQLKELLGQEHVCLSTHLHHHHTGVKAGERRVNAVSRATQRARTALVTVHAK